MENAGQNPRFAQPGWPPAVVAGGYQTGVVLMRCLRRRKVNVSCVEYSLVQPGFRSVYGQGRQCPDPNVHLDQWLDFMIGLARQSGDRPVLIPSSDVFVVAMAKCAAELEKHYRFAQSMGVVQSLLATKRRQYDIAAKYGLAVPRTAFVSSAEELRAFAASARFPCLLKPDHFTEWERFPPGHPLLGEKIALADSPADLESQYRLAADVTPQLMAQEVIQGPDTAKLVYLSCYAQSGERIGACLLREIRTMPPNFGSASVVVPVSDPEVDQRCDAFLRGAGYTGICEIELKRDIRDSSPQMIEANPRYSVTADAGPYAGVDLGWLHYLDVIGTKVNPVFPRPRDIRHIVLQREIGCFRKYLREGLATWGDILRCYRPPVAFFDFDLRDYRITASHSLFLLKELIGPEIRRIFPRRA
jgi:predicted ATP-grasp superfamily ATP-dependent carboligase